MSARGQTWLEVTAPYDKAWNILTSLKPILLIGASVVSLYSIKHPKNWFVGDDGR
nr:YqjK-like family protein [Proteus mirabilis]